MNAEEVIPIRDLVEQRAAVRGFARGKWWN